MPYVLVAVQTIHLFTGGFDMRSLAYELSVATEAVLPRYIFRDLAGLNILGVVVQGEFRAVMPPIFCLD